MTKNNKFISLVEAAEHIVVVQADNPDADSLGSALALEYILTDYGKEVSLYCGVGTPDYLKYMESWSRVDRTLPTHYDTLIIVDASTDTLLEKLYSDPNYSQDNTVLVLDHHHTVQNETKANLTINDPDLSSTGELIYNLCHENELKVSPAAAEMLLSAILGDTQGLSNNLASPDTYRIVASLLEIGVNRAKLEEKRRSFSKMPISIFEFKAELIARTEFFHNNMIAIAVISQDEINTYSPLYNPAALVQSDMLQVEDVMLSIVFKTYRDGKITAAIRANNGAPVAASLAEQLGGGGHQYASGFKIVDGRAFDEIKITCIDIATELLNNLDEELL